MSKFTKQGVRDLGHSAKAKRELPTEAWGCSHQKTERVGSSVGNQEKHVCVTCGAHLYIEYEQIGRRFERKKA